MELNQNLIVTTLRNQGVPESEIQTRLRRWNVGEASSRRRRLCSHRSARYG